MDHQTSWLTSVSRYNQTTPTQNNVVTYNEKKNFLKEISNNKKEKERMFVRYIVY